MTDVNETCYKVHDRCEIHTIQVFSIWKNNPVWGQHLFHYSLSVLDKCLVFALVILVRLCDLDEYADVLHRLTLLTTSELVLGDSHQQPLHSFPWPSCISHARVSGACSGGWMSYFCCFAAQTQVSTLCVWFHLGYNVVLNSMCF